MTALQSLRAVNTKLATAQNQISTGLRISEASHNAAYWSISTTMRSDNKAIAAVSDAIGLGAATVDVMYAATDAIVDVLSEFKAKLVLAKGDGADNRKIQQELTVLAEQAHTIAESASFAGATWLHTHEAEHLADSEALKTEVTASFSRSSSGTVSVGTITVDLKATSMLNVGGGGILQKETPSLGEIGGFRNTGINSIAHNGHQDHLFTGPGTFDVDDEITITFTIDASAHSAGMTRAATIDRDLVNAALGTTDGTISTVAQMRAVLQRAFDDFGIPATAYSSWTTGGSTVAFEIGSTESSGHPGSSINIDGVTSTFAGGFAFGLEGPIYSLKHDNMYPTANVSFAEPFTVWDDAEFYFDVQVGPGPLATVTVDRATVNAALGVVDGHIGTAADMAAVIQYAAQAHGLAVTASGNVMTFGADQSVYPEAGDRAARVYVGNVHDNIGYKVQFDLAEVDLMSDSFTVDAYIRGIEHMLSKAMTSAAVLGSTKRRIDIQADFLGKLTDAVNRGIGQLVDADMNHASTRLAALQTQQQLAIQSLQIANSTPQTIMQLFQ